MKRPAFLHLDRGYKNPTKEVNESETTPMGTIKSPIKWQIASEAGAKLSEQKEERKTDLHVSLDLTI